MSCDKKNEVSCLKLDLEYGNYEVGFKSYNNLDTTRYFPDTLTENFRPIQTVIWYPANKNQDNKYMKFKDFLYLEGIEIEFKELDNNDIENLIDTFLSENAEFSFGIPKGQSKIELDVETKSIKDANALQGVFPVIIYATGSNGVSFQNPIVCEYLASNRYIVISSPNIGYKTRYIQHYRDDFKEIETHSKDIEYLVDFAKTLPNADNENIGVIGFSFGGTSSVLASTKDERIKSLVSFDGSVRFNFPIHQKQSNYFTPDSLKIPFLYLAEKSYPIDTLKKYGIPDLYFNYFKELKGIDAFYFELPETMHENFSSWFIKFSSRMPEHGESSIEKINNGLRAICLYTKNFFDWTLKQDEKGLTYLENEPKKNGFETNTIKLIERKTKE